MKYFIYCRKSSEEDTKQAQSLETQEHILLDYVRRNNLQVVDIIKESKSAKTPGNRPLFLKMLERIKSGEATGVLVAHIDRLSRNGMESAAIMSLLESGVLEGVFTPNRVFSSVTDMLYMDFDLVFAAHYSRNLSIRVKEGNATKLRNGERPGKAPFGYVNKDRKIYPHPTNAHFITKAFQEYSTGNYSLKELTNFLCEKGLRSIGGKKIGISGIHQFLTNPFYYGFIKYGNFFGKGIHEPLVSKKTWDKVQEVLHRGNKPRQQKHDFLFRPYITCANCGCRLTATLSKKKYPYYYCTNGKKRCEEHKKYLSEEKMLDLVATSLQDITLDKGLMDLAFDLYIEDLKNKEGSSISQKEIIQQDLEKLDKKIGRLIDLRIEENIEEATFKEKHTKLLKEKVDLELMMSQVKEENLEITLELLEEYKNRSCSFQEMIRCDDFQVKRDLLNSALSNLCIGNQKVLSKQYKLPYSLNAKVPKNPDLSTLLPDLDSNQNEWIQSPLSYR